MHLELETPINFQGESVPQGTQLAGWAALVQALGLQASVRRPSCVSEKHIGGSQREEGRWRVFDKRYQPGDQFADHLTFAMPIVTKSLETFYGNPIWHRFIKDKKEQPLVLLGFDERFTVWTIVNVENISTGEDLVTLKSCSSLGILPQIDISKIPESSRSAVMTSLDAFTDEVYHAAPVSVIDRARDAASQILLAYFGLEGEAAKEPGALTKDLEGEKESKVIAVGAAKIIARLHARAKPVEKAKRSLREVREQDAEFAAQCLGVILCELGWADWR